MTDPTPMPPGPSEEGNWPWFPALKDPDNFNWTWVQVLMGKCGFPTAAANLDAIRAARPRASDQLLKEWAINGAVSLKNSSAS